MAVKRMQKNRMDADGNLNVIHYETEASVVLMEDGTTAEAAISGKQTKLTFDQTPTAGSQNPVTSGGVKEAIDNIPTPDVSGQIESHNTAEGVHANMGWLTADDGVLFDGDKGVAGGVATLNNTGKVPTEQLPDMDYAPSSHVSDTTVHVSTDEKARWDRKMDAPFKPEGKSYLTFSSPNSFTLKVKDITKHWDGTLEYFASDKIWTTWDGTTTLSSVDNDGEHVLYLRGTGNTVITGNSSEYSWVLTGSNISCTGNIENLLDYATVASKAHPTMADYCYYYMFYFCNVLTQAPALPATTLTPYCYNGMFYRCARLTQAPALPATTLADYCYQHMFFGCSRLTQAPDLPATTLATYCYSSMFGDCNRLTQAPTLPATTLTPYCYQGIFQDCTSLTQAPDLPATTLANNCYGAMFSGCTRLAQAPALPVITLAEGCYGAMFSGCTRLAQAPALPATTLAPYCYQYMFNGCTSLKLSSTKTDEYTQEYRIPSSGEGTTTSNALTNVFAYTGGAFTGTAEINTTYYLSSDNMVVRDTEIATLNGYVSSMIDAAIGNAIGGSY